MGVSKIKNREGYDRWSREGISHFNGWEVIFTSGNLWNHILNWDALLTFVLNLEPTCSQLITLDNRMCNTNVTRYLWILLWCHSCSPSSPKSITDEGKVTDMYTNDGNNCMIWSYSWLTNRHNIPSLFPNTPPRVGNNFLCKIPEQILWRLLAVTTQTCF